MMSTALFSEPGPTSHHIVALVQHCCRWACVLLLCQGGLVCLKIQSLCLQNTYLWTFTALESYNDW